MLEDLDRLRTDANLLALLAHYARLAEPDHTVWQDRLMAMERVERAELSRLHGELIAFSWVDQNTGNTPIGLPGTVPACYRVTPAGLRAIQALSAGAVAGDDYNLAPPLVEVAKVRRKREKRPEQEPEKAAA